ncbi:hypothetical protein AL755_13600 [Arthrobacter sp. ERGS1:01]|nr:hypothetical protein AL755_13600 [Arthrobacter sp. ERGS1:01]
MLDGLVISILAQAAASTSVPVEDYPSVEAAGFLLGQAEASQSGQAEASQSGQAEASTLGLVPIRKGAMFPRGPPISRNFVDSE